MKPLIFITTIIAVATLIFFTFVFNYQLKPVSAQDNNKIAFIVEKGSGFQQIAENLEAAKLIRSAASFKLYVLLRGWADKLKPGSYKISSAFNSRVIAKMLYNGAIQEVSLTIPEGWTLSMIDEKLKNVGVLLNDESLANLKVKDFQNKNGTDYFSMFEGAPATSNLEGFLFPDTYRFSTNSTALEVAKRFLTNFQNKFSQELQNQLQTAKLNYYQAVTLASLVEAEIPNEVDRAVASGILWKRLTNSLPLQVDATIIYIKCEIKRLTNCRTLSSADLKIKSDYNTYLKIGLPIGPINNPGLSALKAVLFPQKSDFWYYLSDPKTGQTIFSKTLEEHKAAKLKYLSQ